MAWGWTELNLLTSNSKLNLEKPDVDGRDGAWGDVSSGKRRQALEAVISNDG